MILDELLGSIDNVLNRITTSKLDAYALTQSRLREVNVSEDRRYQKTYNGFYRVRLPVAGAYSTYYNLIEENKNHSDVSLEYILRRLLKETRRIETSFGSKLLATINPNVAPLDGIVLGHLSLNLPKSTSQPNDVRIRKCVDVHNQLVARMNSLITLTEFQQLKTKFESRFPVYNFTDVKILDLLLWQYRPL